MSFDARSGLPLYPRKVAGRALGAGHSYCVAADKKRNSSPRSELNRRNKQMKSPPRSSGPGLPLWRRSVPDGQYC